jgi:chemotaxis protein histidine kinase CheA
VGAAPSSYERSFLLFRLRSKALFGIPLEQVFRLEEFDSAKIQRCGAERVIVYRNGVMPLFSFEKLLNLKAGENAPTLAGQARIPAIVAKSGDGYLALQIESVVDIASANEDVSPSIRDRKGIVGNAYIRDHNVTILDLPTVLGCALSS